MSSKAPINYPPEKSSHVGIIDPYKLMHDFSYRPVPRIRGSATDERIWQLDSSKKGPFGDGYRKI